MHIVPTEEFATFLQDNVNALKVFMEPIVTIIIMVLERFSLLLQKIL